MFSVALATESSFTREGYPTIATVGGTVIFLYTLYYAAAKTGYGGWRNHALWFFFNFWLWLFGLFLVFGPDSLASTTGLLSGPRAAILGLQFMLQASIGVFAIYTANAYASLVFALFGIFNELSLIGSNFFFNYNQPIWTLTSSQCNQYFYSDSGTVNQDGSTSYPSGQRCDDSGYLEFLRVIGTLQIIVNGYLIVVSLLAYATAVPAGYAAGGPGAPVGNPGYGAPAAAGAYTTATTTAPPASYATTGPVYTTNQGVTTTPYTTTTSVPAT